MLKWDMAPWYPALLCTHLGDIAADVADTADTAGDGGDADGGAPQPQGHLCKGSKRHMGFAPAREAQPCIREVSPAGLPACRTHPASTMALSSAPKGKGSGHSHGMGQPERPQHRGSSSSPREGTFKQHAI